MKNFLLILVVVASVSAISYAQQTQSPESPESAELWRIYQQIEDLKASEQDIPQSLYDRYFELDRIVNPNQHERMEMTPLDQFTNTCPGGMIMGPDSGLTYTYSSTGATNTATNNCSYPACRLGRDMFLQLEVQYRDSITITTCGSGFDTYLCVYTGACCGQTGSVLYAFNDNNPEVCGVSTTLQAGISQCFEPGTYFIVLDGYAPAAFGQYRCSIIFHGNSCINPNPEPECPADYLIHEESIPEGCDAYRNTIHCGQGYCGQIDETGDLDVYVLDISDCPRDVTISVWADDTEGRTGFGHGLDSYLRIWPSTCEAPLAVNNDNNGSNEQPNGTDSQVTLTLVPGFYNIEVSGHNGTTGPYEIFVDCSSCDQ
jgi:hypothetical protein